MNIITQSPLQNSPISPI